MTPRIGPVVLNLRRGVPRVGFPSILHSYWFTSKWFRESLINSKDWFNAYVSRPQVSRIFTPSLIPLKLKINESHVVICYVKVIKLSRWNERLFGEWIITPNFKPFSIHFPFYSFIRSFAKRYICSTYNTLTYLSIWSSPRQDVTNSIPQRKSLITLQATWR